MGPSLGGLGLQFVSLCLQPPHEDRTSEKLDDAVQPESEDGHATGLEACPQSDPGLCQAPQQTGEHQNQGCSAKGVRFRY